MKNLNEKYLRKTILRLIQIILMLSSNMLNENLDSWMKIRIAGLKEIVRFLSTKYSYLWIKAEQLPIDDPTYETKLKFNP